MSEPLDKLRAACMVERPGGGRPCSILATALLCVAAAAVVATVLVLGPRIRDAVSARASSRAAVPMPPIEAARLSQLELRASEMRAEVAELERTVKRLALINEDLERIEEALRMVSAMSAATGEAEGGPAKEAPAEEPAESNEHPF